MEVFSRPQIEKCGTSAVGALFQKIDESFLKLIMDFLPWSVCYLDSDQRIIFNNSTFGEWFGKSREQMVGSFASSVFGTSLYNEMKGYLAEAYEGLNSRFRVDVSFPYRSSEKRFVEFWFIPNRVGGEVRGLVIAGTEITELKKAQNQILEAVRSRDEFVSIASHELKTPLTSLKLQVQMRKRQSRNEGPAKAYSPERVAQFMDQTERQVVRLTHLIDDMLDISCISVGKLSLHLERLELGEIVREVVHRLGPVLSVADCQLKMDIKDVLTGYWDRFRLEQALNSLLTNAARYGPGRPVQVTLQKVGDTAQLIIQDYGRGISRQDHERIFQRFERAISSSEVSGMGLGLYITRHIIERHGGTIRVESELGHGAKFIIQLPLSRHPCAADPFYPVNF